MAYSKGLIEKLTLDKDLSIDRTVVERGRFKHFWFIMRKNMSSITLMNFMLLVCAVPAMFLLLYLMPALERTAVSIYNFSGELGMGFPGATEDYLKASVDVYNIRMIIAACMVPCATLLGLGMSGAFYCCRNYLWESPVKLRVHFFRGIKKYWWQSMTSFTYLGIVGAGTAISIINHLKMSVTGAAPWWSYIVMIVMCLITLLSILFMLIFLPMQSMYKFSFGTKIKNTILLALLLIVPSIILLVVMCIPMALLFASFTRIILLMFFVLMGFGFYVLAISEYGQYACDTFIRFLYEQKQFKEEKERLKQIKSANKNKNKSNTKGHPGKKKR